MRIQVRKCPFTGKLFEEKDIGKYILHLKALREEKQEKREYERLRRNWVKWLETEQATVRSFEEIVPWILEHQQKLMNTYNALYACGKDAWHRKFPRGCKITKLSLTGNFSETASNTHCHPRNGVCNWHRKPELPPGYPGWVGRIEGTLSIGPKQDTPSWSEFFELFDIHTGTGSGGKEFGYSSTVFAADWPGLYESLTFRKLATGAMS